MKSSMKNPALLSNLAGPDLPPVALNVAADYQFCVDAGVHAAEGFFDVLAVVGLHDHIACSVDVFTSSVRDGMAAVDDVSAATMQACIDAFAAGYLGRIQQELRLFHGESDGRNQAEGEARTFTYTFH